MREQEKQESIKHLLDLRVASLGVTENLADKVDGALNTLPRPGAVLVGTNPRQVFYKAGSGGRS